MNENVVLCGSNSYEQKYYLNPIFQKLPQTVQDELKIICVTFTEDVGGILLLEYETHGTLILKVMSDEGDILYDEIGSELKIKKISKEKEELLRELEFFYKIMILKEPVNEMISK